MSLLNNMVAVNNLESLLVVPILVFSIAAQENSGYGSPNFSSSSGDFTGPSAATGSGRIGLSGPTARGTIGPSALPNRGRIVGNSILDFELGPGDVDRDNGSRQGFSRQQSGFSPRPIITTGPSVVGGQNGINSIEDRASQYPSGRPNLSVQEQKIYRHLSVHVAPPESSSIRPRPTQAPIKPEIHYQIVFIKAPSPTSQELQEIQLPPPPEMKTLVYVLLKKPEISDLVKISQRPKPKPTKPEVYFIRYKEGSQQLQQTERRQPVQQQQQTERRQPVQQQQQTERRQPDQQQQQQQERRQLFPQTQQDGILQFLQMQQEGRQQFPQQQQNVKQQFPQQQQNVRQQFPQQPQNVRQQVPQQQQNVRQQLPQQQLEGSQQFSQQKPDVRPQHTQQQQIGRQQYSQQQQEQGQLIPQQRVSNNGSNNIGNSSRQQQQDGPLLETAASPSYGGYENSADSIADSDYQHETSDENSFSLSSYDQALLPEYSYTANAQYGITS